MNFQDNITACKQYPVKTENLKIQKIAIDTWIVYTREETILTRQCESDVNRQILQGTYTLVVDDSCDTYLQDQVEKSTRVHFKLHKLNAGAIKTAGTPLIELPKITSVKQRNKAQISLKEVNLDDFKFLSGMLKNAENFPVDSEKENLSENPVKIHSVSLATVCLYCILALSLLSFIMFKYKTTLRTLCKLRNHQNSENPNSDNITIKDGGVMSAPDNIFINKPVA